MSTRLLLLSFFLVTVLVLLLPPVSPSPPLAPVAAARPHRRLDPKSLINVALIDLHTHTTQSDGTLSPLSLVRAAAAAGVTTLGWTDHDQLAFEPEVQAEAQRLGVALVKGVEISVEWPLVSAAHTVKAHLLGYWVRDDPTTDLYALLSTLRESRHTRNMAIIAKLAAQGVTVTPQQLLQQKQSGEESAGTAASASASASAPRLDYVGRPHFARVLVGQQVVKDIKEAFSRFLSDEKLQAEEWSVPIDRAIRALHDHGGVSVLAHPSTLNLSVAALQTELVHLLDELQLPLNGLEAFSSRHSAPDSAAYASLADSLGLIVTGGSDFHGSNKANVPLGVMGGGHEVWRQRAPLELQRLRLSKETWMSSDEFSLFFSNIAWHLATYCSLLLALLTGAFVYERDKSASRLQDCMRAFYPTRWLYSARDASAPVVAVSSSSSSSSSSGLSNGRRSGSNGVPLPGDSLTRGLSSLSTPVHFLFCFMGLQLSYLSWGYLQERMMTSNYDNGLQREEFVFSEFVVFSNRLFAVVVAAIVLFLRGCRRRSRDELQDSKLPELEAGHPQPHGHAPRGLSACPPYKYMLCSLTNILSSWLQYESLHFVSFPLQVLSKSSKILFTMLMGRLVSQTQYSLFSYAQAALIVVGLVLFRYSEIQNDVHRVMPPWAAELGVLLLAGYTCADSFTSTWQGRIFKQYRSADEIEMMLGTNTFSSLFTLSILIAYNQLLPALVFAARHPDFALHCLVMSFFSAMGQLFIFHTISVFGAVAFASIMTLRQLLSLVLSLVAFAHPIGWEGVCGLVLVFVSLSLKIREDVMQQGGRKGAGQAAAAAGAAAADKKAQLLNHDKESNGKEKGSSWEKERLLEQKL